MNTLDTECPHTELRMCEHSGTECSHTVSLGCVNTMGTECSHTVSLGWVNTMGTECSHTIILGCSLNITSNIQVIKGHPGNVFNVFPLLGFLGGRPEVQQVRVKRRPREVWKVDGRVWLLLKKSYIRICHLNTNMCHL